MSEKYFVTIREIHEFADKTAKENPDKVDVATYDFVMKHGCAHSGEVFENSFHPMEGNYHIEVELSENGHVVAHAYDLDESVAYASEYADLRAKLPFEEFLKKKPDFPEEKFNFDIPLTRGFSDTPERIDTKLTYNDVDNAINEYISKKEGKQKIYPWMMRQFACASDFGLEEEEFDTILEDCCALA